MAKGEEQRGRGMGPGQHDLGSMRRAATGADLDMHVSVVEDENKQIVGDESKSGKRAKRVKADDGSNEEWTWRKGSNPLSRGP